MYPKLKIIKIPPHKHDVRIRCRILYKETAGQNEKQAKRTLYLPIYANGQKEHYTRIVPKNGQCTASERRNVDYRDVD